MKRALHLILTGASLMALASSAAALPPPGGGEPEEPPPPTNPPPPPPANFQKTLMKTGSIGNSTLGASYQATLQVYANGARTQINARGYASSTATLLGSTKNLVIINGIVNGGATLGSEVSTYLLGQQAFMYQDSFQTTFQKTFGILDKRWNMWSYQTGWTFLGTGVTIRLAVDGGTDLKGTVSASPLAASGSLNPRAWVDAGGTLSASFLWMNAGSLTGTVRVIDAQAQGTAALDATNIPYGGAGTWSMSGSARLCSLGGSLTGCAFGRCGTLVSWSAICPGWAALSGQTSGTF